MWSDCDFSQGPGMRERTRMILIQPQFGGDPCPDEAELAETEPCFSMKLFFHTAKYLLILTTFLIRLYMDPLESMGCLQ